MPCTKLILSHGGSAHTPHLTQKFSCSRIGASFSDFFLHSRFSRKNLPRPFGPPDRRCGWTWEQSLRTSVRVSLFPVSREPILGEFFTCQPVQMFCFLACAVQNQFFPSASVLNTAFRLAVRQDMLVTNLPLRRSDRSRFRSARGPPERPISSTAVGIRSEIRVPSVRHFFH